MATIAFYCYVNKHITHICFMRKETKIFLLYMKRQILCFIRYFNPSIILLFTEAVEMCTVFVQHVFYLMDSMQNAELCKLVGFLLSIQYSSQVMSHVHARRT